MEKAWVPNLYKILYKTTIKKAKKGQIEGLPPVVGFLDQLLMHPINERDKEGQRGTERENQGLAVSPKRERERGIFWGGLEMFLILGGIRVIFAVPLIHLKSGAPPTVDPRVLNFKGSNFKTLLTIFWGRAHVFLLIGVRLLIGTRD